MAKPPRSGIGVRWTLGGPGWSTRPRCSVSWRTGTVRLSEAISATPKAIISLGKDSSAPRRSASRQHFPEDVLHVIFALGRKIPVHRAPQPIAERDFRFPTEKLLSEGIIGHAICRACGHVRKQPDLGLEAG